MSFRSLTHSFFPTGHRALLRVDSRNIIGIPKRGKLICMEQGPNGNSSNIPSSKVAVRSALLSSLPPAPVSSRSTLRISALESKRKRIAKPRLNVLRTPLLLPGFTTAVGPSFVNRKFCFQDAEGRRCPQKSTLRSDQ